MVKNRTSLLIACFVWLIAGINIVRIGLLAYVGHITFLNIILSIIVFCLFWFLIFNRLINKHTIRIAGYETKKQYFWYFFDLKSFIIMTVMMNTRYYHSCHEFNARILYSVFLYRFRHSLSPCRN